MIPVSVISVIFFESAFATYSYKEIKLSYLSISEDNAPVVVLKFCIAISFGVYPNIESFFSLIISFCNTLITFFNFTIGLSNVVVFGIMICISN